MSDMQSDAVHMQPGTSLFENRFIPARGVFSRSPRVASMGEFTYIYSSHITAVTENNGLYTRNPRKKSNPGFQHNELTL